MSGETERSYGRVFTTATNAPTQASWSNDNEDRPVTAPERRAEDEPSRYALVDGLDGQWLVEIVNHPSCTCGGGYEGHHEPGCGQDPVGTVESILDGLTQVAAERQLREQAEAEVESWKAQYLTQKQAVTHERGRYANLLLVDAGLMRDMQAERDSARAELARLREAVHAVERELAWLVSPDAHKLAARLRAALAGAGQGEEAKP